MSAKVRVHRIFRVHGRGGAVVAGVVESGTVRTGMIARIWVDGGLYWCPAVTSVDYLDVDRAAGLAEVAMWLDVGGSHDDLHGDAFEDLVGLCRLGDVLDVEDPASP
jgi:hypothetical protein